MFSLFQNTMRLFLLLTLCVIAPSALAFPPPLPIACDRAKTLDKCVDLSWDMDPCAWCPSTNKCLFFDPCTNTTFSGVGHSNKVECPSQIATVPDVTCKSYESRYRGIMIAFFTMAYLAFAALMAFLLLMLWASLENTKDPSKCTMCLIIAFYVVAHIAMFGYLVHLILHNHAKLVFAIVGISDLVMLVLLCFCGCCSGYKTDKMHNMRSPLIADPSTNDSTV